MFVNEPCGGIRFRCVLHMHSVKQGDSNPQSQFGRVLSFLKRGYIQIVDIPVLKPNLLIGSKFLTPKDLNKGQFSIQKNISCTSSVDPITTTVACCHLMLRKILLNLNAVKSFLPTLHLV